MIRCRICGNEEQNTTYRAREMMLGLRHEFDYFQCAACECLQIAEFPADMTPYYPPTYIGFGKLRFEDVDIPGWTVTMFEIPDTLSLYRSLQAPETRSLTTYDLLAKTLAEKAVTRYLPEFASRRDKRILDVGCGDGGFIYYLREIGFTNVMGVDLFIDDDIEYGNGVRVRKGTINDVDAIWDVIMLHHAFEHMPDPLETLQAIARRLAPQGVCLIRIPIASSFAWEHYRINWIQLDAPRHFFLHSLSSLEILSQQSGMRLDHTLYDSHSGGLIVSEMYKRDISLADANPQDLFSSEEIESFVAQNKRLNEEKRGDQAAFYLGRAN